MSKIIIAEHGSLDDDAPPVIAEICFGGVYFFPYPDMLQLAQVTGQVIDPQQDAIFVGKNLDQFEAWLHAARQRAATQPSEWDQRTGRTIPAGEPIAERTSKKEVVDFLDRLINAVPIARKRNQGIAVVGT